MLRHRLAMLARIARSQAINVRNVARGSPLTYQGASAMTIDDDDLALAARLLDDRSGWADAAPVEALEREFAAWNGSRSAAAFVSGRVALRASLDALGMAPGDEVVVPGYSCVVVANALRAAGVRPVFADIELDTYGLDKDALRRSISPRTRAVLIHHLYGYVTRDLDDLLEIARGHGLAVVEDCAQAAGAEYRGRKVGNFGDVAVFSGDPSKPFTCVQGGIAASNDEHLASRLAEIRRMAPRHTDATIGNRLRNVALNYTLSKDPQRWWKADLAWMWHGDEYHFGIPSDEVAGAPPADAGYRMSAPVARLASNQLRKLDHYNERRRANARRWDAWCDAAGFTKPAVLAGSTPIVLRYPVLVTAEMKRDLRWAYRTLGVVPGTWFVTHLHPAPGRLEGVPNATAAVERCINFPTLYFQDRWRGPRAGS
jgi:perosamine synthetase